ncbi:MAG: hypothetical protein HW402_1092 [Dehalococcoidales bacterium]|nr:hypothetical protein [Dehalococcoidales bacterium]
MFPEVEALPQKPIAHLNLLRGISSLVEAGLIKVSGLYLDKKRYGGRYLQWVEDGLDIPETDWRYYLRNYLLRHLLEMHFSGEAMSNDDIDLVLDRVMFSETQRVNTLSYLNSKTQIRQPFAIPPIKHLTVADSEYVGALQLVHIIADLVRNCAGGRLTSDQEKLATSFKLAALVGHKKSDA